MKHVPSKTYLKNPTHASSLPYWKIDIVNPPEGIEIRGEGKFSLSSRYRVDEAYFKLIHHLENLQEPQLPEGYEIASLTSKEFAEHINSCFKDIGTSEEELEENKNLPVYDASYWLGIRDKKTNEVVATAIGELDKSIGEGVLEWVEVSEPHREKGLGHFLVNELLNRYKGRADFVIVSGRMNNPSRPVDLYTSCGFEDRYIWHVVAK